MGAIPSLSVLEDPVTASPQFAFDRRTLFRGGLSAAALVGVSGLLAACGSPAATQVISASGGSGLLPNYIPYSGTPTPDLPSNPNGLAAAYLHYPKNPKRVTSGIPGDGSTVTSFTETFSPAVPGESNNQFWQAVNKRLGVKLQPNVVAAGDYATKFATIMAGNALPDYTQIIGTPPQLPALLQAKFENLAPWLAGDKIKDYPFLANIPQDFWSTGTIYNDGIYGIPIAAFKICNYMFQRTDLIEDRGLDANVTNWDDFVTLCKEVTDPKNNQWALATAASDGNVPSQDGTLAYASQCLGIANVWSESGGKFKHYYTDPRQKDALSAVAKLVKAGYVHPDGFSATSTQVATNLASGRVVMMLEGLTGLANYYGQNTIGSKFSLGGIGPVPFSSGTTAHGWQRTPDYSITGIKKTADKGRVKMLLDIANYLAAPFGSEEYLFLNYGVQGVDWNYDATGEPVQTATGKAETTYFGVTYISIPPRVLYTPGISTAIKQQYDIEKALMPQSIGNPATGLYSATNSAKGTTLDIAMLNTQKEILKGNQPISAWDDAVANWKSQGGNSITSEYEKAFEAKKS